MGICPKCALDSHKEHTGYYPITIGGKGKLGVKNRQAACECYQCVKRVIPKSNPVDVVTARNGKFTTDPCPDCKDPAHWVAKPVGEQDAKPNVVIDENGVPRVHCYGCSQCVGRKGTVS